MCFVQVRSVQLYLEQYEQKSDQSRSFFSDCAQIYSDLFFARACLIFPVVKTVERGKIIQISFYISKKNSFWETYEVLSSEKLWY